MNQEVTDVTLHNRCLQTKVRTTMSMGSEPMPYIITIYLMMAVAGLVLKPLLDATPEINTAKITKEERRERKEYSRTRRAMAAALVVGQEISLDTGLTDLRGKVVKTTWWSVYVRQIWENERGEIVGGGIIRFDKEGTECRIDDPLSLYGPIEIKSPE